MSFQRSEKLMELICAIFFFIYSEKKKKKKARERESQ